MKNETVSNTWEILSEFNEFPLFDLLIFRLRTVSQHIITIIIIIYHYH